jgi:uncharacterized protein DUF3618
MGESPSALRRDVDEARDQLGETVEELAYRVTAPRRVAARARGRLGSPLVAAAIACAALAGVVLIARHRS